MPDPPKQKRAELTRQRLIEAGTRLFSRDGFHATSSKKIAREAEVSIGSFYNHFKDKKDLFITIYQDHVERVHQMIFDALKDGGFAEGTTDGRQLVQMIISQTLQLHTLSPELHREMTVLQYSDEEMKGIAARENERVVRMVVDLLASNRGALRVDDLEAAVRVVVSSVEEVVHSIKIFSPPIEESRLVNALAEMIHRFLYRARSDRDLVS